jgi:hypothetical protein
MKARTFLAMAIALMLVAAIPIVAVAGDKRDGPMYTLPGENEIPGTFVRVNATDGAAHITVRTTGLVGGNAYTLWSISFSHPENCEHGGGELLCGFGDDGPGPQGFAFQQVAGHIAGKSGKVNFGGTVPVVDADEAEYHIVVADHGVKDPALLPGQIKTPHPGVQIGFILP